MSGACRMSDEQKQSSDLSDIDARLKAARGVAKMDVDDHDRDGPARPSGAAMAARIGVELVVTTLVGTGLGWALDTWLGTIPWFMILFMFLGGAAGVSNVYRVVHGLDDAVGLGRAIEEKKRRETK